MFPDTLCKQRTMDNYPHSYLHLPHHRNVVNQYQGLQGCDNYYTGSKGTSAYRQLFNTAHVSENHYHYALQRRENCSRELDCSQGYQKFSHQKRLTFCLVNTLSIKSSKTCSENKRKKIFIKKYLIKLRKPVSNGVNTTK